MTSKRKALYAALVFCVVIPISCEIVFRVGNLAVGMVGDYRFMNDRPVADHSKTVVLCVGDSFTFGEGAGSPRTGSYPAHLQRMLGDGYQLVNVGVPGMSSTMMYEGLRDTFMAEYEPDVVLFLGGMNNQHREDVADAWIADRSRFWLFCKLVHHELTKAPNRPTGEVLARDIVDIRALCDRAGCEVIVLEYPRGDDPAFFVPDGHCTSLGYELLALGVYEQLTKGGHERWQNQK